MNLLYANDRRGQYPNSWYAATATPLNRFAPMKGAQKADVCVIGAGYTGLSAALHLAEAGRDVVLLEAQRVGFGASGRNGGQLGSGQRQEQDVLEKMVGLDHARRLWQLGQEAKALVRGLIAKHSIDCHLKPGIAHTASSDADVAELHAYADHLATVYGYEQIETLDCGPAIGLSFARLPGGRAGHGGRTSSSAEPRPGAGTGRRCGRRADP